MGQRFTNQIPPITSAKRLVDEEERQVSPTGGEKGSKMARFDLIASPFLWQLAEVCGFGAKKYDDDNWRKGYDWGLSFAALQRHLHQFWQGEEIDQESGLPHLAHAAWHCMVLLTFSQDPHYSGYDNRHDLPELTAIQEAVANAAAESERRHGA